MFHNNRYYKKFVDEKFESKLDLRKSELCNEKTWIFSTVQRQRCMVTNFLKDIDYMVIKIIRKG